MAGLTALNEETSVSTEDSRTKEEQPGVKVGTGKSAVIANESVLAQMQKLYEQKHAQQQGLGGFIESLKDASAWTSGGVHGPTEALGKRAEDKSKRAAELFDMQNKIAAQKNAIADRDRFFGTVPNAVVPTSVASTTGEATAPAGGATAPVSSVSPGVSQLNQQSGGLLDLVQDPALRQAIGATYLQDPPKAMSALNAHLAKRAEEPAVQKEIRYLTAPPPQGLGMSMEKALPIAIAKIAGPSALVPHDVRTTVNGKPGTYQTTPLDSARTLAGSTAPGAATTTAPGAATTTAPGAATTTAPGAATTTAPGAATIRTPKVSAPAATPSKEDVEVDKDLRIQQNRGVGSESEGRGKTDATTAEALEKAGGEAPDNIRNYEGVMNILHETPRAVGIAYRSGPGSVAIKLVEDGVSIPFAGSLKIPGMEEAVARGTLTDKELQNRATFNSLVGRLAAQYKKEVNQGMGSQSDADAKAAEVAFGLSSKNPAKSNLILAVLQMEKEKLYLRRNEKWKEYQRTEKAAGRMPQFRDFKLSKAYSDEDKLTDKNIREQLPDLFKGQKKKTPAAKTKQGSTHSGW